MNDRIVQYFALARERHAIYLRRQAGKPRPWTDDPIFQQHRFCNVFRELDTTTVWFREHIREPLRDRPEALLATVVFRLFNRISTGEAIWGQPDLITGETAFDEFLVMGKISSLKKDILALCGTGPYVTGSYIVRGPNGMPKLDAVLWVIEQFAKSNWRKVADLWVYENTPTAKGEFRLAPIKAESMPIRDLKAGPWELSDAWYWFLQFPYIGPFNAYEFVSDLRHTALLDRAPDIMTWANPGPGCRRGLEWITGGKLRKDELLPMMRELLTLSQSGKYWPPRYPTWEMREVEHWACEVFKYQRIEGGGAGTRMKFRGGA